MGTKDATTATRLDRLVRLRSMVEKLLSRDQRIRKRCGKGWIAAFVAPKLPTPRSANAKRARQIIRDHGYDPDRCVTLHVYDVVAMIEDAMG